MQATSTKTQGALGFRNGPFRARPWARPAGDALRRRHQGEGPRLRWSTRTSSFYPPTSTRTQAHPGASPAAVWRLVGRQSRAGRGAGESTGRRWTRPGADQQRAGVQAAANHIYSEQAVQDRWDWQSSKPLWLLLLRRLQAGSAAAWKCSRTTPLRSWIDLAPSPAPSGLPAAARRGAGLQAGAG